jgi:hypothetical protein
VGGGGNLLVWIGRERIPLRIVAVVPDALDLYGDLVVPTDLLPPASDRATGPSSSCRAPPPRRRETPSSAPSPAPTAG